jgi:hypothetical protein
MSNSTLSKQTSCKQTGQGCYSTKGTKSESQMLKEENMDEIGAKIKHSPKYPLWSWAGDLGLKCQVPSSLDF